jgi:hypothetical protein
MVTLHENGKTYKVYLRNAYAHICSERDFRTLIENAIVHWEKVSPAYGAALRTKSIRELISIFGLATQVRVK